MLPYTLINTFNMAFSFQIYHVGVECSYKNHSIIYTNISSLNMLQHKSWQQGGTHPTVVSIISDTIASYYPADHASGIQKFCRVSHHDVAIT